VVGLPHVTVLDALMSNIVLFEEKQVRRGWNETDQKWYFSIIDTVTILTGNERPRKY
jgi:hypothetical protein